MIIVKLIGGLGNQMFQYSAGRCVAERLGTKLKLDISNFKTEGVTKRDYLLKIFSIQEHFATAKEIGKTKILLTGIYKNIPRFISLLEKLTGRSHIVETDGNASIGQVPDSSYLDGNWNSEKYFSSIVQIIKNDFAFRFRPDSTNKEIIKRIQTSNSVSIHVRRGDYVTNSKVNQVYHQCTIKYYLKAISILKKQIVKPVFFVFSDDVVWAKSNLSDMRSINFIENNTGNKSYEDMRLMSLCKHNIIANSSFSWWGAWLNNNRKKIIIAPKLWFKNNYRSTNDLIPNSWLKI